jgi:hypothetical protein
MLYHTCRFEAAGGDGQPHAVLAYPGQPNATAPTAPEALPLRTLDGHEVERLERGRYRVRKTDVVLTFASPDAPWVARALRPEVGAAPKGGPSGREEDGGRGVPEGRGAGCRPRAVPPWRGLPDGAPPQRPL